MASSRLATIFDREDQVRIFRRPILLGRPNNSFVRQQCHRLCATANLNARLFQLRDDRRQKLARDRLVHQQRLGRVADCGTLHLRVVGHVDSLLHVRGAVHVDVADSFAVSKNGNAAVLRNKINQCAGTARNDQVDVAVEREKLQHVRARLKQAYRIRRDSRKLGQGVAPDFHQRFIRVQRLRAALQNHGVAGFQGERSDLRNHLGPRLEHDADHAQRARFFVKLQALVEFRRR